MPATLRREGASVLARLGIWHRLGERRVEALRSLLQPRRPHVAASVLRYFDLTQAVAHRHEEDDLFPALVESMAGSDAVCVRELARAATLAHGKIESAWNALRPAVLALARGEPAVLQGRDIDTLAEGCRSSFALEDREILPMAGRLLDDATLRELARRLAERRAAGR